MLVISPLTLTLTLTLHALFVSDIRVSFNELVRLLGWVYRVYYPCKKRLSNEERKEVIEKFIEWYGTTHPSTQLPTNTRTNPHPSEPTLVLVVRKPTIISIL